MDLRTALEAAGLPRATCSEEIAREMAAKYLVSPFEADWNEAHRLNEAAAVADNYQRGVPLRPTGVREDVSARPENRGVRKRRWGSR